MASNAPTRPKTSCQQHRVQGYEFKAGLMVCRACGLHSSEHDSVDDAMAAKAVREWAMS